MSRSVWSNLVLSFLFLCPYGTVVSGLCTEISICRLKPRRVRHCGVTKYCTTRNSWAAIAGGAIKTHCWSVNLLFKLIALYFYYACIYVYVWICTCLYIYTYIDIWAVTKTVIILLHYYWAVGLMSSVCQWSGRLGFNHRSSHIKDSKNGTWYLLA